MPGSFGLRWLTTFVVVTTLTSTAAAARAGDEPAQQAAARALFDQGLEALRAERWDAAADRFGRAYALRPTPEIAYNLSSALIRTGRLVRASELLRRVSADAEAPGPVRTAARTRLKELLPRLGKLTVRVEGDPALVRLDGKPLDPAVLGVAFPVDPGTHSVEATQGRRSPLTRTVVVDEGGAVGIVLDVDQAPRHGGSLLRKWWFWTAAAAVAAGSATAFALSRGDELRPGTAGTVHVGGK